jgi:hypothetical protein
MNTQAFLLACFLNTLTQTNIQCKHLTDTNGAMSHLMSEHQKNTCLKNFDVICI